MRYLPIILIFFLCLTLTPKLIFADNTKVGEKVNISTWFKIEILNNGKLIDDKMLVQLNIFDYQDKLHVVWKNIYIKPLEEQKKVVLKAENHSADDGSITDVIVHESAFEFILHVGLGRTVKIMGTKKGKYDYSIEGIGLWWSDILNRKIKTEWRTTDKIILPYKEVF